MEERKDGEKQFHDALRSFSSEQRWSRELEGLIRNDPMWVNMKYYAIERKSRALVNRWYEENCAGRKVLDFCCGNGDDSFLIARSGAREVVGVDISEVSIENCRKRAAEEKIQGDMSFYAMDAEGLGFDGATFDVVSEYGALHHLDLEKAYSEIARVLKPGGKCICTETLGHNPLIHLYRKKTPHLRTPWEVEHILKKKDIEKARYFFDNVHILGFFYLAILAAVPFRRSRFFSSLLGLLETVDDALLKMPFLKWQAWQVVFVLENPKVPDRGNK
ncbi:MAG: class I SAM-dependent methyltransferase [Candidatus Omnitrophica bacterium]|nr:class I SAM-dependent methyltransferase [Candidatus Omnitrophota bacterium]